MSGTDKAGAPDWGQLRTGDGLAHRVPQALIELGDMDPEVRKKAYWKLDNHVVVQGTLYEAAYYVIKPLQEMLEQPVPAPARLLCLRLLYEIRNGNTSDLMTIEMADGERYGLRFACQDAVESRADLYARDLRAPQPELRSEAIDLLTSFDGMDNVLRELMTSALTMTNDDAVKVDVEAALRELDA